MKAFIKIKSIEHDETLNKIIGVIESLTCNDYFLDHIGKSQQEQKAFVTGFQNALFEKLKSEASSFDWYQEHKPSISNKDSIDIFGKAGSAVVIIEIDKPRADQVAKKFVSRMALLPEDNVYFISLCYPGTKKMNPSEVLKYFGYCSNLAKLLNNVYAGLIIEKKIIQTL